jgi:hypothetical protein
VIEGTERRIGHCFIQIMLDILNSSNYEMENILIEQSFVLVKELGHVDRTH